VTTGTRTTEDDESWPTHRLIAEVIKRVKTQGAGVNSGASPKPAVKCQLLSFDSTHGAKLEMTLCTRPSLLQFRTAIFYHPDYWKKVMAAEMPQGIFITCYMLGWNADSRRSPYYLTTCHEVSQAPTRECWGSNDPCTALTLFM
jgi:hypothetical protein